MIKGVENNQPSNVLRIEYMLGNVCNQKCSYCFPGSNEGDSPCAPKARDKIDYDLLMNKYAIRANKDLPTS